MTTMLLKPTYRNQLTTLPDRVLERLTDIVLRLERDPRTAMRELGAVALSKADKAFRVRLGDYRLVFTHNSDRICLHLIGLRRNVYSALGTIAHDDLNDPEPLDAIEADLLAPAHLMYQSQDPELLPITLTNSVLESWRIPNLLWEHISKYRVQDDLLDVTLPVEVFDTLVDQQYPRRFSSVQEEADYLLLDVQDLKRLAHNPLTRALLYLDEDQKKIAQFDPTRLSLTLVTGGPGSGKSTVALYRIYNIVEHYRQNLLGEQPSILFVTYTHALTRANEELLVQLLSDGVVGKTVHIKTINQVASDAYSSLENIKANMTRVNSSDQLSKICFAVAVAKVGLSPTLKNFTDEYLLEEIFEFILRDNIQSCEEYLVASRHGRRTRFGPSQRRAVWNLHMALADEMKSKSSVSWRTVQSVALQAAKQGIYKPRYDFVFIDEAQDCSTTELRLLVELCKHVTGLFLTADENQSLYPSGFSWNKVHEDLHLTKNTQRRLNRSYRNTREITAALYDLQQGFEQGLPPQTRAPKEMRSGERPSISLVEPAQLISALAKHLCERCMKLKLPISSAAVLVAGDKRRAHDRGLEIANALRKLGIPAKCYSSKELKLDAPNVKVLSMFASKGLEFPVVAIVDVDEGILPRLVTHVPHEELIEERAKDQRLFYVAASRALSSLAIFADRNKSSEFLAALDRDLWNFDDNIGENEYLS